MEGVNVEEKISKTKKPITENGKRLMSEAFKQGFEAGKLGIELEVAFDSIWKEFAEKTFSKPEWKPYEQSARDSYHFCFENGYASGVYSGSVIDSDSAFRKWFNLNFEIV